MICRALRNAVVLSLAGLLWAAVARADCGPSISQLSNAISTAEAKLRVTSQSAEAARARVVSTYGEVDKLIAAVATARGRNDERAMSNAFAALAKARAAYTEAVAQERPALIARIEEERALRGTRQARTDALNRLSEQGRALVSATARAQQGEVAPSVSDMLACEGADCARISALEHAALMTIGAVPETFDRATPWPADRSCEFTILSGNRPGDVVQRLRQADVATAAKLRAAEQTIAAARQSLAATGAVWDKAITDALEAFHSPVGNSHADELLGMAIEDLAKQSSAFNALTGPYRAADAALVAARAEAAQAAQELRRHLGYWSAVGRAVIDAAADVERGRATAPRAVCPGSAPAETWSFPVTPPSGC